MRAPELSSPRPGLVNTAPADVCDFWAARPRWGARNGRPSPLGSAGALEMAVRTRSAPPGRSKLLGLAARKHRTCRRFQLRARSAPLGRSKWPLEPARLRWGARDSRSNSLGSARALEIARPGWSKTSHLPTFRVRARSAPLGRSIWPLEPARLRWGARNGRSNSLELARLRQGARNCSAWLLENIAPADVSEFEPARLRWGARHWRSSPLGSAGPETLHWARPRMPAALNTETNILRAWYARVRPSIYIYIY